MSIKNALAEIRKHIEKQSESGPLTAGRLTLLAASKGQDASTIEKAIAAGISDFGENRVQEAASKWPELKKRHPSVRLHLIGPLQTNKINDALALFDVIQTIDRVKLADGLGRAMEQSGRRLPCYIQVNTGKEPQKAGVLPQEADTLITHCTKELGLAVEGLMCIPPHGQPPAPHFALLRDIAQRNGLQGLSMGMSEDYMEAVRMGATCIRLGRILFGERKG